MIALRSERYGMPHFLLNQAVDQQVHLIWLHGTRLCAARSVAPSAPGRRTQASTRSSGRAGEVQGRSKSWTPCWGSRDVTHSPLSVAWGAFATGRSCGFEERKDSGRSRPGKKITFKLFMRSGGSTVANGVVRLGCR